MTNSEAPILEEDRYTGAIALNAVSAPITFRLSAGSDCRLLFDIDPVDTQTYLLVMRNSGRPGQTVNEFSLNGHSEDGKTVTSYRMSLSGSGSNQDGHCIRAASQAATVMRPLEKAIDKPLLRLWFRSFSSFRNPTITTPLGTLEVQGNSKDVDLDDMSGNVAIQAPSRNPGADWYDKADIFLRHMHRGLALAHGGRLQTPRLDYIEGDVFKATFFAGSGFRPEFPVQHHLNHGPFIQALADCYLRRGPLPDVLWTALGWMQTDTTFDEIRFLTAMTALETIIEGQLPERRGTAIPNSDFRGLRGKLEDVIMTDERLHGEAQQVFLGKIAGLNKKTFSEKIAALFDHFEIPKRDFDKDVIVGLVRLRNEIVHRGGIPDSIDVWPQIILVRELITRILLREIGFKGRYCSYVGGLNDRDFPDTPSAVI